MKVYEIPLSPDPQRFTIALGPTVYQLTLWWNNQPGGGWTLDIGTSLGDAVVTGIPLTTGNDLLEQYGYLGFAGQLVVQTDQAADQVPTYSNLGVTGHLYFVTSP